MAIEFFTYHKGGSKDLLSPHREEINQLGLKFENEVFVVVEETRNELFETLDYYDFVIFAAAEDEGRIIGFATVRQRPGMDKWELVTAYVDSPYRRRGIWKKMTEIREQLAVGRAAGSIVILPQQFLRNTLISMGFEESFIEEDMRKTLRK